MRRKFCRSARPERRFWPALKSNPPDDIIAYIAYQQSRSRAAGRSSPLLPVEPRRRRTFCSASAWISRRRRRSWCAPSIFNAIYPTDQHVTVYADFSLWAVARHVYPRHRFLVRPIILLIIERSHCSSDVCDIMCYRFCSTRGGLS